MKFVANRLIQSPTGPRERLYTLDEAADELKTTKRALSTLLAEHDVKPSFPTRPYRYPMSAIKDALNKDAGKEIFKIKKNVPVPARQPSAVTVMGEEFLTALRSMEIGDCVPIPNKHYSALLAYAKKKAPEIKVMTRKSEANPEVRLVWRVKKEPTSH